MTRFPPEPFQVRDSVDGDCHLLVLSGELDLLAAPQLEDKLVRLFAEATTGLVLDLRSVTFMDSSGLRAILVAKELTDEHRCSFSVIPGPPSVQRLFEVTALLDILPFEPERANPTSASPAATGGAPKTSG
jgi:anti-anti-sigma factor